MDCIGVHTAHMSTRVMSLVFTVLRNGLHRCTHCAHVETCDVTRVQSGTEWIASVYTLHTVETCDVTRVQSGTKCTASVYTLSERVMSRVFQVLRNGLHRYTHCIHVETCDVTRVQSGTEWIASVYTLHTCRNV